MQARRALGRFGRPGRHGRRGSVVFVVLDVLVVAVLVVAVVKAARYDGDKKHRVLIEAGIRSKPPPSRTATFSNPSLRPKLKSHRRWIKLYAGPAS